MFYTEILLYMCMDIYSINVITVYTSKLLTCYIFAHEIKCTSACRLIC